MGEIIPYFSSPGSDVAALDTFERGGASKHFHPFFSGNSLFWFSGFLRINILSNFFVPFPPIFSLSLCA